MLTIGRLLSIVTTLAFVATTTIHAQSSGMVRIESAGRPCAGAGPRDSPPRPQGAVIAECFLQDKGIRDSEGLIVSGIGLYAWRDGTVTRVRVYTLVPALAAPNRWLNEMGDDPKLKRPKFLADYTLAVGESKSIAEMKSLGVEPLTLRFSIMPRI